MSHKAIATIQEHFSSVEDPRVEFLVEHNLLEMIVIAICAVICGANNWVAVADWGETKLGWLKQYLKLENGIPTHDTFRRVFLRLKPEQFQLSFMSWMGAVFRLTQGQVIAVDGKEMHGTKSKTLGRRAIDMVSAWATTNRLVLGQRKVDEKSNEITAIPTLLELLGLEGCLVTIDAMGCQREIAAQIVEQGGDYLLAVKENQGHLYQDIEFLFECAQRSEFKGMDSDYAETVSEGHGRREKRECWIIDGIENQLHWTLDVAFQEDKHQLSLGNGAANFAVLRHIAASLLKQEQSAKCGIANKRLKAAWDEAYLLKVLQPA